jgi:Rrf2 family protein
MHGLLNVSERVNEALHALALIEALGGKSTAQAIAARLGVSPTYLAKVMQPLAREGFLRAERGKTGGYALSRPAAEIKAIEVYEVFEGELPRHECLFPKAICETGRCPYRALVAKVDALARDAFSRVSIAELARAFSPARR